MENTQFDIIIIGSGPGGYTAAIRCSQLGMKTALVEKYNVLGGTCTNVGCIPSKTVLDTSEKFFEAQEEFKEHGIKISDLAINFSQMMSRKEGVVATNNKGIDFLMKKNNIEVYNGLASFKDEKTIQIKQDDGRSLHLNAEIFIIATGSKPMSIPGIAIDKNRIISSTEALSLKELPSSMIIIGGGIIGCELGSVYARLGTQVTVLEYTTTLISEMDRELGSYLRRVLRKTGVEVKLEHQVKNAIVEKEEVTVSGTDAKGNTFSYSADYCLVATGRAPFTKGLNLAEINIKTDEKGRIITDKNLQTNVPGIYAIGDVIKGPMLAHKAMEEAVFVAENIAGEKPFMNYLKIPSVVYTWPEVAGVGRTEEELQEEGVDYRVGKFPFKASARARISMDTDGFFKVLAHRETDQILGVHIIGARAADLISAGVSAMEFRITSEEQADISFAHPTFMEAFKNACLDVRGIALDI